MQGNYEVTKLLLSSGADEHQHLWVSGLPIEYAKDNLDLLPLFKETAPICKVRQLIIKQYRQTNTNQDILIKLRDRYDDLTLYKSFHELCTFFMCLMYTFAFDYYNLSSFVHL